MNTISPVIASEPKQATGSRYILWMLLVTFAGLMLFSVIDANLVKKYSVPFADIYQKKAPAYIEEGKTFKTDDIILSQLFVPAKNTKFTVVIPTLDMHDSTEINAGINTEINTDTNDKSLFAETMNYQLTKNMSTALNPTFIKYLSSLFAFKRGEKEETKITANNKKIEFFRLKTDQYYASGIFSLRGKSVLVTAFCPSSAVDYELFLNVIKDLGLN